MENLADALRIAAGVLLALLLISTLVYVFRQITIVEDERQQQILIKQVTEFNNMYLAYQRTRMYGTDVMSVISLAINQNKDMSTERYADARDGTFQSDGGHPREGYVNIRVKLKSLGDIKTRTTVKTIDHKKPDEEPKVEEKDPKNYFAECTLTDDGYLDLKESITVDKFNKMIIDNSKGIEITRETQEHGLVEIITTVDNIGFNDFKKTIFTCTDIKYTNTGRIYEMSFDAV